MHQFRGKKDSPYDRQWRVEINIRAVRKVWDVLRVDMNTLAVVNSISSEDRYRVLPELLAVLLDEQFAKAFPGEADHQEMRLSRADELVCDGSTFAAAHEAVTADWADFARLRGQTWCAEQLDQLTRLLAKQQAVAEATVRTELANMDTLADKELARLTPGNSSTTSPADSELQTSAG